MTIIADQIITPLSFVGSDFTAINLFLRLLLSFFFLLVLILIHAVRKPTSDHQPTPSSLSSGNTPLLPRNLLRTEWMTRQHPRPRSFVGDDKWPLYQIRIHVLVAQVDCGLQGATKWVNYTFQHLFHGLFLTNLHDHGLFLTSYSVVCPN